MAIQDSNPERRNLTLLSMAIILFYLGEGKIIGETIRFQVVNIQFKNPEILFYFVWILLLWFALRYWQTHRHKPSQKFKNDIESLSNIKLLRWYTKKKFDLPYNKLKGFNAVSLSIMNSKWTIKCQILHDAEFDAKGNIKVIKNTGWSTQKEVTGVIGMLLKIYLIVIASVTKTAVSEYVAPYLLFLIALVMPCLERFKEIF